MPRMSDIVVTPDDRLGSPTTAPPPRKRRAPRVAAPARPRSRRRVLRRLLALTLVQKVAAGGVLATAVIVSVLVVWHSGWPQRTARDAGASVLRLSGAIGLRTAEITVSGRKRTPLDQIVGALGARHGDPILGIDIEAAKDRLEALPSVRSAAIERRLPGSLHLSVSERQPSALWQIGGRYVLVDRDGHQIPGGIEGYEGLPLVVGEGAPQRAEELFEMLSSEPGLAGRVKAATRVGNRRWTLTLDAVEGGIVVHLPEIEPEKAWAHLAQLERKSGLTRKGVTMVDLRVPDRLVLRGDHDTTQSAERSPGPPAAGPLPSDGHGED